MIIDAAGERSEQGHFLSKSPGSSNAVLGTSVRDECLALSVHFSAAGSASEASPESLANGLGHADVRLQLSALRTMDVAQCGPEAPTADDGENEGEAKYGAD
jgi:hypothetical protein